jgi:predicted enzyme related to lactoylglutathione lyase
MNIAQIRTITVFVSDQDRAKSFYVENRWLEVVPAGGGSAIVLHKPFPGMTAGSAQGVILQTSHLDTDVDALRAAGVAVDGPRDMPWGRQATFADPDGNGYMLSMPAPPA